MTSSGTLLYLSRADVEQVAVRMPEIIAALERMFAEKGEGRVEMPPKPGIHPRPDAFIHAMPAYIPAIEAAGLKWVSGYPTNAAKGLPYIAGLLVLNDPDTGIPLCVMDCTWITAKRTGAATAVAAKRLARGDSRTVGVLGCGVQGYSNLEALACLFDLRTVLAYDIVDRHARAYAERVRSDFGLDVRIVSSAEQAVCPSDIIVTAGPILKHPEPVIEDEWFRPGAFASPVDFDSYWKHEPFRRADKFYTDDVRQMMYYRDVGYFQGIPATVLDLGDLVAGKAPGRESDDERIICVNLGLALDDMATAPLVYRKATEKGIGRELPL